MLLGAVGRLRAVTTVKPVRAVMPITAAGEVMPIEPIGADELGAVTAVRAE